MKNLQSTTTLHNGVEMPWLGLGVFKVEDGQELINAVKTAIKHGYRSIDTAAIYGNEVGVGQGIREGIEEAKYCERRSYLLLQKFGILSWAMNRQLQLMKRA